MCPILSIIFYIAVTLLRFLLYFIFATVIVSLLEFFDFYPQGNRWERLSYLLKSVTQPMFEKARSIMPFNTTVGAMDFSPLIVIIGIQIMQLLLIRGFMGFCG
ncbi:MAG: YggT family protein [Alphaproteobacteria bacterium]|nr:YggT family protein [Alphaproteobacteria bacterium]